MRRVERVNLAAARLLVLDQPVELVQGAVPVSHRIEDFDTNRHVTMTPFSMDEYLSRDRLDPARGSYTGKFSGRVFTPQPGPESFATVDDSNL